MRSKSNTSGRDAGTFLSQARRRQFVECAIEALVELGFTGTTLAEVARRAAVSKSVVLYHFASRTELMLAVIKQVYADATPPVREAMEAAETHRDRVLAYVRASVHFAWTHQGEAKAVLEIGRNLRNDDGTPFDTVPYNNRLVDVARELLEAGQQAGEFGDFDTWTLAVSLRATIDALAEQFLADPRVPGSQVAEHFVQLVDRVITSRAAA